MTLTTDFGTQDGYVGAMKGRILSMAPQVRLVDISHEIDPQNRVAAAWCLFHSTPNFAADSIHLVVVDPGVGSERAPILLKSGEQWYIGPDNGIFSHIVGRYGWERIIRLHDETRWWRSHQSFDGLALFSPAAACLANGVSLDEMGTPIDRLVTLTEESVRRQPGRLAGQIVFFDRFGNGITNITRRDLETMTAKQKTIRCRHHPFTLVSHYRAGADHERVAIVNSDDRLELSVFCGSARQRFQLAVGDPVIVTGQVGG